VEHLISIGNEGVIEGCKGIANGLETVDYITFHAWAQNWGWFTPRNRKGLIKGIRTAHEYIISNIKLNKHLEKPMVLEEFGLARDKISYNPTRSVRIRDSYFRNVFQYIYDSALKDQMVSGVNFWAYGGQGRPREDGGWWAPGDDFIGDPPHERQGWYSIYDSGHTTLEMIESFTQKFDKLCI